MTRGACALACVVLLACAGACGAPSEPPVRVAAAASLTRALADVEKAFVRQHGQDVEIVFGASGTLTRQILDGAPFELFLAADEEFPQRLTEAGLTQGAGTTFATGRLVLFAPTGSPLVVDERLEGLARLVRAGVVTRFAIANPDAAPYGRAAEAVLRTHGLWDAIRPALVLGDTIAQAAQFAATGNAVGGLLAYSVVRDPAFATRGTYALVPDVDHPPLRHRMVLLSRAGPVAARFYAFVQTDPARAIFGSHGFGAP